MTISVELGDERLQGRSIDLRPRDVDAATVATAIEQEEPIRVNGRRVVVDCPSPGPVHERVGVIAPDRRYEIRTALAVIGRERGYETPQDEAIDRIEAELTSLEFDPADSRPVRRRLAELDGESEELGERVAALRGRVRALRERDDATEAEVTAARQELQAAIGELTDLETDRIAAEQALDAVRSDARVDRDRRERRLQLQDRLANRRRAAREHLAERLRPAFESALAAVPGSTTDASGSFPTGATAALAVCRIAPLAAPVVVADDRFPTPAAAVELIGAPAILVEP